MTVGELIYQLQLSSPMGAQVNFESLPINYIHVIVNNNIDRGIVILSSEKYPK